MQHAPRHLAGLRARGRERHAGKRCTQRRAGTRCSSRYAAPSKHSNQARASPILGEARTGPPSACEVCVPLCPGRASLLRGVNLPDRIQRISCPGKPARSSDKKMEGGREREREGEIRIGTDARVGVLEFREQHIRAEPCVGQSQLGIYQNLS
ncbi:hypothetical protein T484DRAFT_2386968 [Baffinella frigidus]|nr:hypothetical protein T484DRAFT_2386968 [Cryptophyta sp. CCMP2293]